MTTAEEIRDALAEALDSEIGTYTFTTSDGIRTTKAIRLEDDTDPYTVEPDITGLEVVVRSSIDVPIKFVLDGYEQTFSYLIQLKQHDIQKTTLNYINAVRNVIAQFGTLNLDRANQQIRFTKLDNVEVLSLVVSETVLTYGED